MVEIYSDKSDILNKEPPSKIPNTIIQMNDLTYDSFLKILKSKNSSLKWNKEFFDTNGQIIVYTPDRKLTYQVFASYRRDNL